jgi:hypothetical protein
MTPNTRTAASVPPLQDAPVLPPPAAAQKEEPKESTTTAEVGSNLLFLERSCRGEVAAAEAKELSPVDDDDGVSNSIVNVHVVSVNNEMAPHCDSTQNHQSTITKIIAVQSKKNDNRDYSTVSTSSGAINSSTTTMTNMSSAKTSGTAAAAAWRQRMQDSLYEREEEESKLQAAFEKCCCCTANAAAAAAVAAAARDGEKVGHPANNNKTDFLLISGPRCVVIIESVFFLLWYSVDILIDFFSGFS